MPDKILLVDDDPEARSELREILDGYDVLEASSGEDALKLLKKVNEIALVILDVFMSGASGLDILRQIKKTDPHLNTIILTGYSSKSTAIEALRGHADDYIEKPVNIARFIEAVERSLGKVHGLPVDISIMSLEDKIKKTKRFIESNRYKKVTLEDAAKSVCMSPKYLGRVFKTYSKIGFTDYKLGVKIKAAKELLEKSGEKVDQISYRLGYENTESFIRQFKKIVKMTPSRYKQKYLEKKKMKVK